MTRGEKTFFALLLLFNLLTAILFSVYEEDSARYEKVRTNHQTNARK